MMKSRLAHLALAATSVLGCVALSASCGARSELWVPTVDGAGGAGGGLACKAGQLTLTRATPVVMFVIDRSGSMQDRLSSGKQSRWQILRDALDTTLPPVDDVMMIGGEIFPWRAATGSSPGCAVPLAPDLLPAKHNAQALIDLVDSTEPAGATPTAAALSTAGDILLAERTGTTGRSIVLATDGGPNCNDSLDAGSCRCTGVMFGKCLGKNNTNQCLDDVRAVSVISWFASHGIPTYVLGIQNVGDDEYTSVLNAMADAGGRPQSGSDHFYPARSQGDVEAALTKIRDQIAQCTYLTSSIPDPGGTFTVSIDGQLVPFDASGKEGWSWGNESNGEVLLAGAACQEAEKLGDQAVTATVACAGASIAASTSGGSGGTGGTSASSTASSSASTASAPP